MNSEYKIINDEIKSIYTKSPEMCVWLIDTLIEKLDDLALLDRPFDEDELEYLFDMRKTVNRLYAAIQEKAIKAKS